MARKTIEDLGDDLSSIGGAMRTWPVRTLAWTCRDMRVSNVDDAVVRALLDREVEDLADLEGAATDAGVDPSNLREKRLALADVSVSDLRAELEHHYQAAHGGADPGGFSSASPTCPFEESGMDKACWRCPVPGRVLDSLREDTDA